MDKSSVRKSLLEQRYNLAAKGQKAEQLQQALRIWLLSRPDTVIGAYWPIKGEFDPLPALYRWQEDGVLNKNRPPGTANDNSVTALLNKIETKITDPAFQDEAAAGKAADILDAAAGSPRKIGLPVINKVHKTLTFHAWYPGCPMEEDAYKIPKPKDTELLFPTLLLVPCVGFGPGGYRLGYGGGFYDRTLATLQPKPFTVGLGFSVGFVPEFVPQEHDIPLDAILTEQGLAWGG